MKNFKICSLNISEKKGVVKTPVNKITVKPDHGIVGDAHAANWHRQISLLAIEDVKMMQEKLPSIKPGDFAENITTEGIDLPALPIGTKLMIDDVVLEVTQIGKECHNGCEIKQKTGDCVMPRRGIFAKVLKGGDITNESIGSYNI